MHKKCKKKLSNNISEMSKKGQGIQNESANMQKELCRGRGR